MSPAPAALDAAELAAHMPSSHPDPDREEYGRYGNPTVRDLEAAKPRKVDVSQSTLDVVRTGLYDAANSSTGASGLASTGAKASSSSHPGI